MSISSKSPLIDYRPLESFLNKQSWKEADEETLQIMRSLSFNGGFPESVINEFPCEVLQALDELWVRYSHGRFGFSVQRECYLSFFEKQSLHVEIYPIDDRSKPWREFGKAVGWADERNLGLGNGLYGEDRYWLWDSPRDAFQYNSHWYENLTFSLSAPVGHLPILGGRIWESLELINQDYAVGYGLDSIRGACLFKRLELCGISSELKPEIVTA
jgi:GUN4-like